MYSLIWNKYINQTISSDIKKNYGVFLIVLSYFIVWIDCMCFGFQNDVYV